MPTLKPWRKGDPLTAARLQEMQTLIPECIVAGRGIEVKRAGQRVAISAMGGGGNGSRGSTARAFRLIEYDGVLLHCTSMSDDIENPSSVIYVSPPIDISSWYWAGLTHSYRTQPTAEPFLAVSYAVAAGPPYSAQTRIATGLVGSTETFTEQVTPPYGSGQIIMAVKASFTGIPNLPTAYAQNNCRWLEVTQRAWARVPE